jgi:hypothetical protein
VCAFENLSATLELNKDRSYDPRKPLNPVYPSVTPSVADFVVESDDENPTTVDGEKEKLNGLTTSPEQTVLLHAPPG